MPARWICASLLGLLLLACGGGGGGGNSDPQSGPNIGNSPLTDNPPSSGGNPDPSPTTPANPPPASGDSGDNGSDGPTSPPDDPAPTPADPSPVDPPPTSGGGSDGDDGGNGDIPPPGPLTDILFNNPTEIASDASGNLYVVDGADDRAAGPGGSVYLVDGAQSRYRLRQIAPDGSVTTLVTEDSQIIDSLQVTPEGEVFYSTTEPPSPLATTPRTGTVWQIVNGIPRQLRHNAGESIPIAAVDPQSRELYFYEGGFIKRLTPGNEVEETLFALNSGSGPAVVRDGVLWMHISYLGREGYMARWSENQGFERFDHTGWKGWGMVWTDVGIYITTDLYVNADHHYYDCTVLLFNPDNLGMTRIAGAERQRCAYPDGNNAAGVLPPRPRITQGSDGNFYLTDFYNHVILKLTPDGEVGTYAGRFGEEGD